MNVTRIILMKGAVETLEFFSLQMAKAFEEQGVQTWFWDMKAPLRSREAFEAFPSLEGTVLLTFNFIGLSGEAQFLFGEAGTVWDVHNIKVYCIMVDHPMYYYKRLESNIRNLTLICIDRGHQAFVEQFYPDYGKAYFLPLAGTFLPDAGGFPDTEILPDAGVFPDAEILPDAGVFPDAGIFPDTEILPGTKDVVNLSNIGTFPGSGIPYEKRTIDVVFTGNYVPIENLMPHIRHMDEESKAFYFDIIRELTEHSDIPMEEELIRRLHREFPAIRREETLSCLHSMIFIDLYVRSYFRQKVICALAENNISVLAVGKDWEKAGCRRPENIKIVGMQDSLACLQYMGRAKIAVNVMPWFKDGAHDRIFNGMLQGCAVVTDSSKYLDEILLEGTDYVGFSLKKYEETAQKVTELLEHPAKAKSIAQNGFQKARQGHTWAHRACELLNSIF